MNIPRCSYVLALLIVMLAAICTWRWTRSDATVPLAPIAILRVDARQPGKVFDLGAVGLSTETLELATIHLSAEHYRLVRLMRMLGPSVLRIGEDSVDFSWWTSRGEPPPPWATNSVTPADLSALRRLLSATGWRVILGVDFGHFEPARVTDEARYAQKILGTDLLGIEIGNEPDDFGRKQKLRPPTYTIDEYIGEAEAYRQALSTAKVRVYGPALSGPALGKTQWLPQMGTAMHMFTELTLHYYPTSTCTGTGLASTGAELLSPDVRQQEDETVQELMSAGSVAGRPTRIGETNTAACATSPSAAPVFASALWALDWALRATSSGVEGLNFHGGFGVCGPHSENPVCAFNEQAAHTGDVTAQPEYYGLLAARQLEGGRFVPTSLTGRNPLPNTTTWATIAPGGTIKIAIDNLTISGLVQPVSISIAGYTATAEQLAGPSITASSGITFGATQVTGDGLWRPRIVGLPDTHSSFQVLVRPSSAVIVTLRREHSSG